MIYARRLRYLVKWIFGHRLLTKQNGRSDPAFTHRDEVMLGAFEAAEEPAFSLIVVVKIDDRRRDIQCF